MTPRKANEVHDAETDAAAGAALGAELERERAAIVRVRDDLIAYRGDDGALEFVDLERYAREPRNKRGTITVHTPDGLVEYASRHKLDEQSTLWADLRGAVVAVVFDDASVDPEVAGWRDHRAVLTLRRSPEWDAWIKLNERDLAQVELAEFLEERVSDVVHPVGADLLEVARTFHATSNARFKSSMALHSGEQSLVYETEVTATAGAHPGAVEVPREFVVALRPFDGATVFAINGRFRFRVREGRLTVGYRLLNLDEASETAVRGIVDTVAERLELKAIHGVAPGVVSPVSR